MIITFLDIVLVSSYFLLLFLSIFWLLVLFSPQKELSSSEAKQPFRQPTFASIVPAFNEEKGIAVTLQSLCDLDYPIEKREIMVVNDGSTDKTGEVVEKFIQSHPNHNITLINQENRGKGAAMNRGLASIHAEFFACLDADSSVAPNALQVMLPLFDENPKLAAVCPLLKVKQPQNILQKVQWTEYVINMFYKFLNSKIHCIHVTPGPFSVYRTEVISRLGGYDEKTITEDLEIAIRLQKYHYQISQTFATAVETESPRTWKSLFRQRVRWYRGSVDNSIAYRDLMFNKKYGDFGVMRMPTIIASGAIAIILTVALAQDFLKNMLHAFFSLKEINFDIFTLLKNYQFHIDFLGLPFFKLTIAFTMVCLSFFVMYASFKLVGEKITRYGRTWTSMMTYLLIYSFFITTVWIYIAYSYLSNRKTGWLK
ncbi:glycosyltransferase family 2 protein [Candidatus Woesearchaeota archaeon]|nr:glycosyltransferase family 2 protein [Candidatus Woesearchaeota archaeon]